jgi:hypothetical protein
MAINLENEFRPSVGQLTFREFHTKESLDVLVDGSLLTPGGKYVLNDFVTIHNIPNSGGDVFTSGVVEPIELTANSVNTFHIEAKSLLHPKHELKFRYDLDTTEDGLTTRPGMILERYDPDKNTRVGEDYLQVRKRRWMITGKVYQPGVKVNDTNVTVTVNANVPGLGNQSRYEVSFETMVHPSGPITLTLQYNNGTIIKQLLYHLDQAVGASLPADYLSGKKGTIIYNPILDSFVLMGFTDIGAECIGQYLSITPNNFSIGHGGISFTVDSEDFQDFLMFNSNFRDIDIPANFNSAGSSSFYNNSIFKGEISIGNIGNRILNTTFNSHIGKLVCPGEIVNSIILAGSNGLDIEVEMNNSLILPEIGSFPNSYHRYSLVNSSTIKPSFSTQIKHRFEFSTLIPSTGASNTVIDGIVGNSNIFYSGIPISVGSNFYIQQGLYRCLIGFIDARFFTINKSLNDETIFKRENTGPYNILGTVISLDQTLVRAAPNNGSAAVKVQGFKISEHNDLYGMRWMNTQNVQAPDGEVQYFLEFDSNAGGGTKKTRDMIGITRGAVTILGGRALPETYYNTIVTEEGNNAGDANYRYPLRQYMYGVSQMEEGIIVGTDAIRVGNIAVNTKVWVEGDVVLGAESATNTRRYMGAGSTDNKAYVSFNTNSGNLWLNTGTGGIVFFQKEAQIFGGWSENGVYTVKPGGEVGVGVWNGPTWRFGQFQTSTETTINHYVEIEVGSSIFEVPCRLKV